MSTTPCKDLQQAAEYLDIENLLDLWHSEESHTPSRYELVRVDQTTKEILSYLSQLVPCAVGVLKHETNPAFYHKHRGIILKLSGVLQKVNAFLREAFSLVGTALHANVLALLQSATLQAMDTIKLITNMSMRSEQATNMMELRTVIISELEKEISVCKGQLSGLKEGPSPFTLAIELSIYSLLEYLSSASLLSSENIMESASSVLAFSDAEKTFCEGINALACRLNPVQVSVDMLKYKVATLSAQQNYFSTESDEIQDEFCVLENDWKAVVADFVVLKNNKIGTRLVSVCKHLNTKVLALVNEITQDITLDEFLMDSIGSDFKICSAAINFIRKILSSQMTGLQDCILQYNEEISPKWNHLNEILQERKNACSSFIKSRPPSKIPTLKNERNPSPSLKALKLNIPRAEIASKRDFYSDTHQSLGLGINLHLCTEPSPSVPFSIAKTDRIIDLNIDSYCLPRTSFQIAMFQCADENAMMVRRQSDARSWNNESLHPSTPSMCCFGSPSLLNDVPTTETTPFYKDNTGDATHTAKSSQEDRRNLLRELRKHHLMPSRIPTIVEEYLRLKLPVLRKKYKPKYGPSRIPTISPDNQVFYSPDRRSQPKTYMQSIPEFHSLCEVPPLKEDTVLDKDLRSPPAFLIAQKNTGTEQRKTSASQCNSRALGDLTNKSSRLSSWKAPAGQLSLSCMRTPNLAFTKDQSVEVISPISWRSTLPGRPESPLGSRFDDEHLIQPLRHLKKRWK